MQQSLNDAVQVGIVSFMAFPELGSGDGDAVAAMERLAGDGFFEQVDVTRINDPDVRSRAIGVILDAGIEAGFGVHPVILGEGLDLNALDEDTRRAAVDRIASFLSQACQWKAAAFVVLSGKDPGDADRPKAVDQFVRSLVELGDRSAEQGGPPIVLETFDRVPYAKNCLVGPTDLAVEVARRVRESHPGFGLLLDLSHLPLQGEKPAEALAKAADFLSYVHIGNCVMTDEDHEAYGDSHPPFGIPGGENGVAELRDFLGSLFDVGYLGSGKRPVVTFEVRPMTGWPADAIIENARQTLTRAWQELERP